MPADMVHGDERHAERIRAGLRKIHANEHRADKPGGIRHGNRVDVRAGDPGGVYRLLREDGDGLHMAARRDLRHNTAVDRVQLRLREYLIGQYLSAVLHDRNGGLIAGGFKG